MKNLKVHENTIHNDLIDPLIKECNNIHSIIKSLPILDEGKYPTFWLDKDSNPKTLIEYIVQQISIQDYPNGYPSDYMGMEWWIQIKKNKEDIVFHYDKDEALCTSKKIYHYPLKSTITYLTDNGGPTAIFNNNEYNDGYLSFPKTNKHVVFKGDLFHGVIGPLSKKIPNNGTQRVTLLINYWNKRPMEPNCTLVKYDKYNLLPLSEEHIKLQSMVQKEKSKIIKMNYKNGSNNVTIYRTNTPILIKFSKDLREHRTYSFKYKKDIVHITL